MKVMVVVKVVLEWVMRMQVGEEVGLVEGKVVMVKEFVWLVGEDA